MAVTSVRSLMLWVSVIPHGNPLTPEIAANGHGCGWAEPAIGLAWAYLSGMEKELQIRLLEELERAWVKCLPGRQAAARNELMRSLPTELARRSSGH